MNKNTLIAFSLILFSTNFLHTASQKLLKVAVDQRNTDEKTLWDLVQKTVPYNQLNDQERLQNINVLLKNNNININMQDEVGRTLLHLAIDQNNASLVKLLLENKEIDINAKDVIGLTPLYWAVFKNNSTIAKTLIHDSRMTKAILRETENMLKNTIIDSQQQQKALYLLEEIELNAPISRISPTITPWQQVKNYISYPFSLIGNFLANAWNLLRGSTTADTLHQ